MSLQVLTKELLLAGTTVPEERVAVPQLSGMVIVRGLTAFQRDEFEASVLIQKGTTRRVKTQNLRAKLIALTAYGNDGHRLFSENDITKIGAVRADVVELLFDAAMRLSGMTDNDVDELAKN